MVTRSDTVGVTENPDQPPTGPGTWPSVAARVRAATANARGGDLGSLPIVVGLLAIVVIFQTQNDTFLSSPNLVSLASQIASTGIIATGVMLVLLLGQIDLSVGSISGMAAATLAVANVHHGLAPPIAAALAIAAGAFAGLIHGLVFTRFGVPAFVVTLAGLLAWQGVQRRILAETGTINLPRRGWFLRVGQFDYFGYVGATVIAVILAAVYLAAQLATRRQRVAADLPARSVPAVLTRTGLIAALCALVIYALCQDLGVPWIFVFFLTIVIVLEWVLRHTRYGRYVFATGGNIEAARRAGIRVDLIRTSVFVLAGTLAATGGVVEAMRAGSAGRDTGTGDVLINAIAAAIIGGVSMFGGRARPFAVLFGILVIGSIPNGLNLLSLSDDLRFIITGSVLLAAVVVDAVTQRGRQSRGAA